jgi:hypothetical protein
MAITFAREENPGLTDVQAKMIEEQLRHGNVEALLYEIINYHFDFLLVILLKNQYYIQSEVPCLEIYSNFYLLKSTNSVWTWIEL